MYILYLVSAYLYLNNFFARLTRTRKDIQIYLRARTYINVETKCLLASSIHSQCYLYWFFILSNKLKFSTTFIKFECRYDDKTCNIYWIFLPFYQTVREGDYPIQYRFFFSHFFVFLNIFEDGKNIIFYDSFCITITITNYELIQYPYNVKQSKYKSDDAINLIQDNLPYSHWKCNMN